MACDSLNAQATRLNVSLGALPEGFCPQTMQELGQAISDRLIITPVSSSSSFAIGPIAPTSNVGPWLKDCEEWFVWNDNLAIYVPITKQGYNQEEFRNASGDFIVPPFIYRVRFTAWGAGGGGATAGVNSGAGGGGGAFVRQSFDVIPGQVIPLVIGTGGLMGAPGAAGGPTTVMTISAAGGKGAVTSTGGLGGLATGGLMNFDGQSGNTGNGALPGFGGLSSQGGGGGVESFTGVSSSVNGKFPGGGGAGASNSTGSTAGNGAGGAILIEY